MVAKLSEHLEKGKGLIDPSHLPLGVFVAGHTDVVRDLCVLSPTRFLSAANDASIRLWDLDTGVCIASFASLMEHFIYS